MEKSGWGTDEMSRQGDATMANSTKSTARLGARLPASDLIQSVSGLTVEFVHFFEFGTGALVAEGAALKSLPGDAIPDVAIAAGGKESAAGGGAAVAFGYVLERQSHPILLVADTQCIAPYPLSLGLVFLARDEIEVAVVALQTAVGGKLAHFPLRINK